MPKFKTETFTGKIVSTEGRLKLLSEKKGWLQKVEVWLLSEGVNRNNWDYQNLDEHRHLFAMTPILCAYVGDKIGDGHNFEMRYDPKTGTEVPDFRDASAERIVGLFEKESDVRIVYKDGKKWAVGTGTIFSWYNRQLVDKLKEVKELSVSIETLIDEMHMNGDVEVYTKYQILGTTILNEAVTPAVVGANIKALQEKGVGGIQELTMRVASYYEHLGTPKGSCNTNEPQTQKQKSSKGEKRTMKVMNLEDLKDKFQGYTVLAAKGQSVALMANNGRTFTYTFPEDIDTVIPEKIEEVVVNSVFGEGENAVEVPAEKFVGVLQAKLNAAESALKEKTEESAQQIADLIAKLNKMVEAESKRRKEAVKAAINAQMEENRKNAGVEIAENLCIDLLTDEAVAKYAGMEDGEGCFCGDKAACMEVDARCMEAVRKANKEKAQKAAANAAFSWRSIVEGEKETGANTGIISAVSNIIAD